MSSPPSPVTLISLTLSFQPHIFPLSIDTKPTVMRRAELYQVTRLAIPMDELVTGPPCVGQLTKSLSLRNTRYFGRAGYQRYLLVNQMQPHMGIPLTAVGEWAH